MCGTLQVKPMVRCRCAQTLPARHSWPRGGIELRFYPTAQHTPNVTYHYSRFHPARNPPFRPRTLLPIFEGAPCRARPLHHGRREPSAALQCQRRSSHFLASSDSSQPSSLETSVRHPRNAPLKLHPCVFLRGLHREWPAELGRRTRGRSQKSLQNLGVGTDSHSKREKMSCSRKVPFALLTSLF